MPAGIAQAITAMREIVPKIAVNAFRESTIEYKKAPKAAVRSNKPIPPATWLQPSPPS